MNQQIIGEFSESETKVKCAQGGHRHTITNFTSVNKETKKSLGSSTFKVGDHLWQIVCYPGGETEDVGDYVSLFLGYRGPDKECQATWRLTLVNQLDGEKSRSRAWLKGDKFNKFLSGRRWGWQKFIKREDLLDPEQGYIKDDRIIFEASLDVFLKQTTEIKKPKKFPPLYPVPPSRLSEDFSRLFQQTCMASGTTLPRKLAPKIIFNYDVKEGTLDDHDVNEDVKYDVDRNVAGEGSAYNNIVGGSNGNMPSDGAVEEKESGEEKIGSISGEQPNTFSTSQSLLNSGSVSQQSSSDVDDLSDVCFVLDEGTCVINAHSQILAARSPVLAKLFSKAFKESRTASARSKLNNEVVSIKIVDVESKIFFEVLNYIYSDTVDWEKCAAYFNSKKRSPTGNGLRRNSRSGSFSSKSHRHKKKRLVGDSNAMDVPSFYGIANLSNPYYFNAYVYNKRPDQVSNNDIYEYEREQEFANGESYYCHSAGVGVNGVGGWDVGDLSPGALGVEYEQKHDGDGLLSFALNLFEAADKYELNRLRLICEHKIGDLISHNIIQNYNSECISHPVNTTNATSSMDPTGVTNWGASRTGMPNTTQECGMDNSYCGFIDTLVTADRHNSPRLKRLCFSILTSSKLSNAAREQLLKSERLTQLDPRLLAEMIQMFAQGDKRSRRHNKHEQHATKLSSLMPDAGDVHGMYSLSPYLDVEEGIMNLSYISEMRECDIKKELAERGFPIDGSKAELIIRLQAARGFAVDELVDG